MDGLNALAVEHDLSVIEDCAQAHGAKWHGTPVGGLGDAAAWSFCQDKIMSTGGEGGMLTTNSEDLWNAAWSYKDHARVLMRYTTARMRRVLVILTITCLLV
jgi:dTDP-4-amino-4,6-dideoxygalactose transaminase